MAMVATLQQASILDSELVWAGGQAHLVIVGDILDRGPDSRAVMDLLMRLEGEASADGGKVQVLIGNHEAMLLSGDMRYVSDAEYAAFAAEESAAERVRWFDLYVQRFGEDAAALQRKFNANYPPGYFAMRRAFRADGKYGEWLLTKNVVTVINDTAFVHGGLSPEVAALGLDGVNEQLRRELADYVEALAVLTDAEILLPTDARRDYKSILKDFRPSSKHGPQVQAAATTVRQLTNAALLGSDGPLWYRRSARCPDIVEGYRLDAALAAIGAKRVVVGHTPTPNRQVLQRFDGRLIEIDTGMLASHYGGSGNALVLQGEEVSVISQSGVAASVPAEHPRWVGRRSSNLTTSSLQALLQHGEIVSIKRAENAKTLPRTLVTVSDGEHRVSAVFSQQKSKGHYPAVAAYRLDRLLRLDMVPVTVVRTVDGAEGSLQFIPHHRTDEQLRAAGGKGGGASCPIGDQWAAMYVFDALIYNEGRTQQRMLYDPSSWRLLLSEHDRAFANTEGRPGHLRKADLAVTDGWKRALMRLTDEVLEQHLADVLGKCRLRALASRRDALLKQP